MGPSGDKSWLNEYFGNRFFLSEIRRFYRELGLLSIENVLVDSFLPNFRGHQKPELTVKPSWRSSPESSVFPHSIVA